MLITPLALGRGILRVLMLASPGEKQALQKSSLDVQTWTQWLAGVSEWSRTLISERRAAQPSKPSVRAALVTVDGSVPQSRASSCIDALEL